MADRWCGKGGACPTSQEEADAWWRQATGLWPMQGDADFPWPGHEEPTGELDAEQMQDDLFGDAPEQPAGPAFHRYVGAVSSLPEVDLLIGAQLDYWVAVAIRAGYAQIYEGHTCFADYRAAERAENGAPWAGTDPQLVGMFQPSTDWQHGGYVIQRYKVGIAPHEEEWYADMELLTRKDGSAAEYAYGPTPLIAAARCIVRSVYGDRVPEIYQACEISHRSTSTFAFWRDDPVLAQAEREKDFAMFPDYRERFIALDHAMALLDDELMSAPRGFGHKG